MSSNIITMHPFPFDVLVYFGRSNGLRVKLNKLGVNPENIKARTYMLEGGQVIIHLRHKPNDIKGLSVLSHEIFHAVDLILRRVGIKLTSKSDEIYAYCIQYLTNEIYQRLLPISLKED